MIFWAALALAAAPAFRLHLPAEPTNLDPQKLKSAASSYLIQSLHRGLLVEHATEGLRPDLAESCKRAKKNQIVCLLKKDLKWSDGKALVADDFVRSYRRLLDPKIGAYRPDLLFPVKNARAVFEGKMKPEALDVTAPDARTLRFGLEANDPEFEHTLANSTLAPHREDADPLKMPVSGPYKVAAWEKGVKLRLTANANYPNGNPSRPDVEFRFVEDDGTALKLYEKNELDFLRRLPTVFIAKYEKSPEFHFLPMLRFDYIGFGPKLREFPELREAMTLALDYDEFQKLLNARGKPGCPGVPDDWFAKGPPCFSQDIAAAKAVIAKAANKPSLRYIFSSQGGDDHRRAAEWQQNLWKKHLGLDVKIEVLENKMYLASLRENPPDLFRKGIAADRPTCASVLAPFGPDHPENFMNFHDETFDALLEKLQHDPSEKNRRASCERAIRLLMDRHLIIPLGPMSFAMLAKPNFAGWRLNSMNQLDLSDLKSLR